MNPKKKILLISPFFKSPVPGGGVTLSREICEEWLRRGYEVHVLGINYRNPADLFLDLGARMNLFFYGLISQNDARFSHHMDDKLKGITKKLILDLAPDEAHVHNFHGMLGAVWAVIESGTKSIYTALDFGLGCHSFYLFNSESEICGGPEGEKCLKCVTKATRMTLRFFLLHLRGLAKSFFKREFSVLRNHLLFFNVRMRRYIKLIPEHLKYMLPLYDRFDHIVAPSPPMRDFISKYRKKGKLHEINYPVAKSREFFGSEEVSKTTCLKLLFLGNRAKIKGWDFFLTVLESLPDGLDLEVIDGSGIIPIGKTNNQVQRYLKRSELISDEFVARAISNCDAILVPSLWHENTPLVILESLANHRPVIASNQSGISHIIRHGENGFLLRPGRVDEWSNNLIQWARNPKIVRELNKSCNYDFRVQDYMDAVEKAIL